MHAARTAAFPRRSLSTASGPLLRVSAALRSQPQPLILGRPRSHARTVWPLVGEFCASFVRPPGEDKSYNTSFVPEEESEAGETSPAHPGSWKASPFRACFLRLLASVWVGGSLGLVGQQGMTCWCLPCHLHRVVIGGCKEPRWCHELSNECCAERSWVCFVLCCASGNSLEVPPPPGCSTVSMIVHRPPDKQVLANGAKVVPRRCPQISQVLRPSFEKDKLQAIQAAHIFR